MLNDSIISTGDKNVDLESSVNVLVWEFLKDADPCGTNIKFIHLFSTPREGKLT